MVSESSESSDSSSLFEVFVRPQHGVDYVHCGSVRACDGGQALERARTLFGRREAVGSLWVVPATVIVASPPDEAAAWWDPAEHHPYRSASYYTVPEGVRGL